MNAWSNDGPTFTDPQIEEFTNTVWPDGYGASISGGDPNVEPTANVADSSIPAGPDDTVPDVPRITDDMKDPRNQPEPPAAA